MQSLISKIREAHSFIRNISSTHTEIGIILGTGLGDLVKELEIETTIDYTLIPHFPVSTVESHAGQLLVGKLSGKNVVAMKGRFHFYEGYSMEQITFPIRVMKEMGVKTLIISNACGSLNDNIPKGSIMIIEDHINLLPGNPLIGLSDPELGPRFVDMSEPYSERYIENIEKIASDQNIKTYKGVYSAMSGPSLETRAEYRFLRLLGADAIGMSTVPETIVANQCGMKVLGLSITTDECNPDNLKPVSINEILAAAALAEPALTKLVKEFVKMI